MTTLSKLEKIYFWPKDFDVESLYGESILETKIPIFTGYKLGWKWPFIHKTYTYKKLYDIQRILNKIQNYQLDIKKDGKK